MYTGARTKLSVPSCEATGICKGLLEGRQARVQWVGQGGAGRSWASVGGRPEQGDIGGPLASSPSCFDPLGEYTLNETQISTAKGESIVSLLLNPFGLGFPQPGQTVRGEGCPRALGHPSGDIQAVTNPRPPRWVPFSQLATVGEQPLWVPRS